MLDQIRPEFRPYVIPFGSLFVILIFTILGGSFIFRQISSTRSDAKALNKEIEVLESRLEILSSFNTNSDFRDFVNTTLLAIPGSNPALLAASQIRSAAAASGVILDDMSINSIETVEEKEINQISTLVTISGSYEEISSFTEILKASLPLMNLVSADITSNSELVQADIELISFWSSLPSTLPSLSESISGLSEREAELLGDIEQFVPPVLSAPPLPQPPALRSNPFVLSEQFVQDQQIATSEAGLSI